MNVLIFGIFSITYVSSELLTIKQNDKVGCVLTDDTIYSGVYVPSTNFFAGIGRNIEELNDWVYDDWEKTNKDEQNLNFYPITDIRWETFSDLTNSSNFLLEEGSFSICIPPSPVVITNSTKLTRNCEWKHYFTNSSVTYEVKNNSLYTENSEIAEENYVKYHNNIFRYSKQSSPTPSINYIGIKSNPSCISFFASVDIGSNLSVLLEDDDTLVESVIINGFNEKYHLKTWKRFEITPKKYFNRVGFRKDHANCGGCGFWAIDKVHVCKTNYEIETTTNNAIENYCKNVNLPSINDKEYIMSCNNTGFIGKYCNISCKDITKNSHWEKYKIYNEFGNCIYPENCESFQDFTVTFGSAPNMILLDWEKKNFDKKFCIAVDNKKRTCSIKRPYQVNIEKNTTYNISIWFENNQANKIDLNMTLFLPLSAENNVFAIVEYCWNVCYMLIQAYDECPYLDVVVKSKQNKTRNHWIATFDHVSEKFFLAEIGTKSPNVVSFNNTEFLLYTVTERGVELLKSSASKSFSDWQTCHWIVMIESVVIIALIILIGFFWKCIRKEKPPSNETVKGVAQTETFL